MGISDKLGGFKKKAEDAAVEHKDQIKEAVEKAQASADERTEGKYHEQIAKAGSKIEQFVENLNPPGETGEAPAARDK